VTGPARPYWYVRRERFEECAAAHTHGRYQPQRCPHRPRCTMTEAGFGQARTGWTGPLRSPRQADRETAAWTEAGWQAGPVRSTPEVREQVRAWQRAADARRDSQ
jgi:hypothetical protein